MAKTMPVTFAEGRPLLPSEMPTFANDPLFKQVSDPACSAEDLDAALTFSTTLSTDRYIYGLSLRRAIARNPGLSETTLHGFLRNGVVDAWLNPAVDLFLLGHPLNLSQPTDPITSGLCYAAQKELGLERMSDVRSQSAFLIARWVAEAPEWLDQQTPFLDRWRSTLKTIVAHVADPSPDSGRLRP